jgi:hypothetical protein
MTVSMVKVLRRMVLCNGAAAIPAGVSPSANALVYNFTSFDGPGFAGLAALGARLSRTRQRHPRAAG